MQQITHETAASKCSSKVRRPRRALGWVRGTLRRVADTLALWHFRARSRRELEQLEDRLLKDAGVDRSEANKPFWRA